MLNIESVDKIYLACGSTDLRKSIDGLAILVQTSLKLDPFEKALFVFCNRRKDKLKILHYDNGFWLYYYRLETGSFKWSMTPEEAIKIDKNELSWLLKGYELRLISKPKRTSQKNYF